MTNVSEEDLFSPGIIPPTLIPANTYVVKGLRPIHPCFRMLLQKWRYGVMHGVLTNQPKKASQHFHHLMRSVLRQNRHVLFIDSLNTFNPEQILDPVEFVIDNTSQDWFPQGLFYARPFQFHQFHKILTEQIPVFVKTHQKTRLIVVNDPLRMFLDYREHVHDKDFPRPQIQKLIHGLRVLRQTTYHAGTATIVILDSAYTRINKTEPTSENKKAFPLESFFPVLLTWSLEKARSTMHLTKHFEIREQNSCSEGSLNADPLQTVLDTYI